MSARIQQMRLRLQRYDLKFTYVPGKELHLADRLSRAHLSDPTPSDLYDDDIDMNSLELVKDHLDTCCSESR